MPVAADAPWTPPADAEVFVGRSWYCRKAVAILPQPQGAGLATCVGCYMRSTGIDRFPAWFFEVPLVTVSRGAQAVAIAEYVLTAMLAFGKGLPALWVSSREDWGRRYWRSRRPYARHRSVSAISAARSPRRAPGLRHACARLQDARPARSGVDGVEAASLEEVLREE